MKPSRWGVLSEGEVREIHNASLEILTGTGIVIQNESVLSALAERGASVDLQKDLAKIPAELIEDALRSAPKATEVVLCNRDGKVDVRFGAGKLHGASGNDAVYYYDSEKDEQRPASKSDVANFARIADALPNIHMISPEAVPQDVPQRSTMVHAVEAIYNNSSKHILVAVPNGAEARGVIEISKEIIGGNDLGKTRILSFMVSPTSPLRWEGPAIEALIEGARNGLMLDILSEPISGVTAPITLAGYLVVQNAEFLVGLLISQLINKGNPVMYGCSPTTMDMREARAVVATPEAMLLRLASGQLAKHYGLPSRTNAEADSQCMDEQNCWERILQSLAAVCTEMDVVITQGMYGTGMIVSYDQLIIDNEILGILNRIKRGIDVNEEKLATQIISKVGPGGHFLKEPFTQKNLKIEHLTELISNRSSYRKWKDQGGFSITKVARREAEKILAEHKPQELARDIQSRIRQMVKEFDDTLPS